ncbi:MAG: hypothetical protein ABI868_02665 [Acidobacteriota bacterium]
MSPHRLICALAAAASLAAPARLQAQNRGAPPPPPAAKAAAPLDLTGYWVAIVNEDWRYRMVTPAKGDYRGIGITSEALKIVNAWDPAADEAAGNQCRSYGAAVIMRVPGRIHLTWQDDNTLRLDADAGTQTRLFRFGAVPAPAGPPGWQGHSVARWERPGGRGAPAGGPPAGSLNVVTTNMRSGYLRKNGVPYSENARVTESFDVAPLPNGGQLLVVTTVVDDPRYLTQPFIVSSHFKKEADGSKWDPTPCSSTW